MDNKFSAAVPLEIKAVSKTVRTTNPHKRLENDLAAKDIKNDILSFLFEKQNLNGAISFAQRLNCDPENFGRRIGGSLIMECDSKPK
jgi:hypothetical protein